MAPGDHCVAFPLSPEFFERASASSISVTGYPDRVPNAVDVKRVSRRNRRNAVFDEMAHGLAGAVLESCDKHGARTSQPHRRARISQVAALSKHSSRAAPLESLQRPRK